MEAKIALAFAAGLLSFATPCVLPLVPGYLARPGRRTGRGRAAGRGGEPSVRRRVHRRLSRAAAATGALAGDNRRLLMQAAILVVSPRLRLHGPLPLPWFDRLAKPELVEGARRSGSSALLGAAFAVCAAPCVGPVLATILALASDEATIAQGSFLLLVYSLGLALPFVGIGFARTMGAFRWLRDHYDVVRIVSGAFLVAVGLLLFFDRWWWLNVAFDRTFRFLGIGD